MQNAQSVSMSGALVMTPGNKEIVMSGRETSVVTVMLMIWAMAAMCPSLS